MNNVVDCLNAVAQMLPSLRIAPGQITHSIAQLQEALRLESSGMIVRLEQAVQTRVSAGGGAGGIDVDRRIDIVAQDLLTRIHTEIKTGRSLSDALDPGQ